MMLLTRRLIHPGRRLGIISFLMASCLAGAQTVPLGNLFDDDTDATLAVAAQTDTLAATADESDLGVDLVDENLSGVARINRNGNALRFDFTALGATGEGWGQVSNDAFTPDGPGLRTSGARSAPVIGRVEDGIAMHANKLITFDLAEIRRSGQLGPETSFMFLSDRAGVNDSARNFSSVYMVVLVASETRILAGYVNGRHMSIDQGGDGTAAFVGELPRLLIPDEIFATIQVPLPGDARYLSLAVVGGDQDEFGSVINSDHGVFSGARLEPSPIIFLGNLFDDPVGTPLDQALRSDSYLAVADEGDLGVDLIAEALLGAGAINQAGVRFFFTNLGADGAFFGRVTNDAVVESGVPIRSSGIRPFVGDVRGEEGLGMHANKLITFDLDEIRSAGGLPSDTSFRFVADRAGVNDSAFGVEASVHMTAIASNNNEILVVSLNGEFVPITRFVDVHWVENADVPPPLVADDRFVRIELEVSGGARFLTLATTGAGTPQGQSVHSDHAVFVGARLEGSVPITELRLEIDRQEDGLRLSWPSLIADAILEASDDLMETDGWRPIFGVTKISSGAYSVTAPISDQARFFRLRRQIQSF